MMIISNSYVPYVRCTICIFLTHKYLLMKSNECQNCIVYDTNFGTLSGHKCKNLSI